MGIKKELKYGKIKNIKIKNFGILKDIDTNVEDFTLFLGKNKVGKTTLIEALERIEYIIERDVPVDSNDYYRFLKKLDEKDDTPTSFQIEFEIKTIPDYFSGSYSYLIEMNLSGIIREEVSVLDGSILNMFEKKTGPIKLISRQNNQIEYFRMKEENNIFKFETKEIIRDVSVNDLPCTKLLWDEGREPYMFFIRNMLRRVGGYNLKFVVRSFSKVMSNKGNNIERIKNSDEISIVLQSLKQKDGALFKKLEHILKLMYSDFECFEIPEEDFLGIVYMIEKKDEEKIKIPNYYYSKGTRKLILNLIKCLLAEKKGINQLVILDELEASLHPILLEKYISILTNLKIQIIATTHSPIALNYLEEGDIKIFYEENGNVQIFQGYNKKALARDFELDINDLNMSDYWMKGNDTDLIVEK